MIKQNASRLFWAFLLSFMLLLALDAVPSQLVEMKSRYASTWAGGDLVVKSPRHLDLDLMSQYQVSKSIKMSSMMLADDTAHLVHLQFIEDNYPLYGQLKSSSDVPIPQGGVWVSERFAQQIGLREGDQVAIGDQEWSVAGFVTKQDEQIFDFEAFSPSVFMRYDDQELTGLITPTSRLSIYTYIAGPEVMALSAKLEATLSKDARIIKPQESLGRIERIISQVVDLLWAVRLVGYLMAGFLFHLALEGYFHYLAQDVGTLMALGVRKAKRLRYITQPLLQVNLLVVTLGVVLSIVSIYGLNQALALLPMTLTLEMMPLVIRTLVTYVLMASALVFLHCNSVLNTPVINLMRQHPRSINYLLMFLVCSGIAIYTQVVSWDITGVSIQILSLAVICLFVYMLIYGLIYLCRYGLKLGGTRAYMLLNGLRLYGYEYTFVVMFLSVILTLGVFVWHAQTQLISSWQATFPDNASNGFLIGVQEREVSGLKAQFSWLNEADFYPIIKGRLIDINDQDANSYEQGRLKDHEALNRQLNLTMLSYLPPNNEIIEGTWPSEGLSADSGIMNRLGLKLGDRLTFLLYGEEVSLPITSVRQVDWRSMRANFYFIFPVSALEQYPASYMASAYLPPEHRDDLALMQQIYPGVTYLDVALFIEEARQFVDYIAASMTGMIGIVSIFGLLAFMMIFQRQHQQKKRQMKAMKKLGLDLRQYPVVQDERRFLTVLAAMLSILLSVLIIYMMNGLLTVSWYFDVNSIFVMLLMLVTALSIDALRARQLK